MLLLREETAEERRSVGVRHDWENCAVVEKVEKKWYYEMEKEEKEKELCDGEKSELQRSEGQVC